MFYGGLEKEWKEAVNGLLCVDKIKLEAHDGNRRDCILQCSYLGNKLRATKRSGEIEYVEGKGGEKEKFPFSQTNFIGRKKEFSELELILFGDVIGDAEREYFEIKTRHGRKKLVKKERKKLVIKERKKDYGPQSLGSRMVQIGGWFAPTAIPVPLLALAANKIPETHQAQSGAELNPFLWQELATLRGNAIEPRAKLMIRGGQYDIVRKAVFIRTSIGREEHPDTISSREMLTKITRLIANNG
ncbi:hypothetical protein GIB67_028255, partial [Kingdonia uniflora]